MGLDTSHNCWHGAYSAFSRWRNQVAEAAGYELVEYEYPHGNYKYTAANIDWDKYSTDAHLMGDWKKGEFPDDPLVILICHSDCDGFIQPWHCRRLADRLEGLLDKMPVGPGGGHIWDWHAQTQQFIDGLRDAAQSRQRVSFH